MEQHIDKIYLAIKEGITAEEIEPSEEDFPYETEPGKILPEEINLVSLINHLPQTHGEKTATRFTRIITFIPFIREIMRRKAREFDESYQELNKAPVKIIITNDAKELSYKVQPNETVIAYDVEKEERVEFCLTEAKESIFKSALYNSGNTFSIVRTLAANNR